MTDVLAVQGAPGLQRCTLYFATPGEVLAFQDKSTRCGFTTVPAVVDDFTLAELGTSSHGT
jgi:hypothetical protein